MNPGDSASKKAWPMSNDTSSDSPPNPAQPRNSEWVDDFRTTTGGPPSHTEDLLESIFRRDAPQVAAAQSPTSAYPSTLLPNQTVQVSGDTRQNNWRASSKYSEYRDDEYEMLASGPISARFERDRREEIGSQTSLYHESASPGPLYFSQGLIPSNFADQENLDAHAGTCHSPQSPVCLEHLTQSPKDKPGLFQEDMEDIRSSTSSRTITPRHNFPPQNPSLQPHTGGSQNYQSQLSAPADSSISTPPTRSVRSSSIITGLHQGIYRAPSQPTHNPTNLVKFYATQKDDSRFSRHHPSNPSYNLRKRVSNPEIPRFSSDQISPTLSPSGDRIPTYQEFRQTTQRVDPPHSDHFPLPASANSQYERMDPRLRPPNLSDWKFPPEFVRKLHEERWKINQGYRDLGAYFDKPKQGPYKHLDFEKWKENAIYLRKRDQRATNRELVLRLKDDEKEGSEG
ncbi:hypothetical protein NHQ30_002473 [Ciborinia camelliae]|nr:hypothetical protein NHQ30_002473 [Ciborinia camelliae]